MLKLLVIDNPRVAQAFIDYMASRHIDIDMMPEEGGKVALWLKEDQFQLEAESELKQFLQNPADRKYLAASWEMADSRTVSFLIIHPVC